MQCGRFVQTEAFGMQQKTRSDIPEDFVNAEGIADGRHNLISNKSKL